MKHVSVKETCKFENMLKCDQIGRFGFSLQKRRVGLKIFSRDVDTTNIYIWFVIYQSHLLFINTCFVYLGCPDLRRQLNLDVSIAWFCSLFPRCFLLAVAWLACASCFRYQQTLLCYHTHLRITCCRVVCDDW